MKKSGWSLAGLFVAVLVLGAILWVKDRREGAELRNGFVFDTTRVAEIRSLRVAYRQDSMALRVVGNRWVTTADSFPVDTVRLRKVLGWLLRTKVQETVSDSADAASLWDYGLNPEDARRVEWVMADGTRASILLGKTSTLDFSFTYWKWADPARGAAVFRTPGSFAWDVSPRVDDWREKAFWPPFGANDIQSLTVDWKDGEGRPVHYKVERVGSTRAFRLTEPYVAWAASASPASPQAVEKLFEKATQFAADDFGLEFDPNHDKVSLTDPAMIVTITLRDGVTRTLKAGPVFEKMQYTQHPSHKILVWVFSWRFDYFKKRPEDLIQAAGPRLP